MQLAAAVDVAERQGFTGFGVSECGSHLSDALIISKRTPQSAGGKFPVRPVRMRLTRPTLSTRETTSLADVAPFLEINGSSLARSAS